MIQHLPLGSQGLVTSRLGLGCMGMSEFYGQTDDGESLRVLDRAVELGVHFWDTADMYGPYTNEVLVGKALRKHRQAITLATKFGIVRQPGAPQSRGVNGRPEYVRESCEGSLQRLGIDVIDLYYVHRRDRNVPVAETIGAMADLVKEGKIRAIGLSEVSVETLREAHKVHPVTAVQSEYSLWSREPEDGMLQACKELGVAFVAYSPLGRGFLTGQIKTPEDLAADDYRRHSPRFQGDNFYRNLELVRAVEEIALAKATTTARVALAWVLAQGEHVFPIPGTKKMKYLEDNAAAVKLELTPEELDKLSEIFRNGATGTRYPESSMGSLNG
ncbi:aldo/keto reductase [Flavihumibacter petaseus]|uniref:Putative aldo/keto reductase n=1 Tax=Flavihumibacter petaseus NBRC 106054 TaxID=1220578 RepID=A0A0E9N003_9BACT|nr:aldo/keto reductase [Flavihumibacter petaseus]GAO43149.1 putative aldo/keto reductase [Flavihumibacter petaseus NBRC 106054]